MYTARYLGAAGFGILSFALAFTGIFGVFSDLGLGTLTVREVARDKSLASKYLRNIAVMKIILVVITFGLIALTINLLGYPEQTIKVVYFKWPKALSYRIKNSKMLGRRRKWEVNM